jgi:ribonucleotide monophosphatase NagD (HAD superfamily)
VAAVQMAVRARPEIAGKPYRPLLDDTVRRVGATRPVFVGDRLDTDIAGAVAAGLDSLLVLSGSHGPRDLLEAPPGGGPRTSAPTSARCCSPPASPGWRATAARWGPSG